MAFLKKEPLDVAYDKLMEKYGYHDAVCNSVYFEGPQGARIWPRSWSLHDHPLRQIAGVPVDEVYDYGKQLHYKDGETTPIDLPKSEVVKFVLDDKSTVTVRPSGTEPKCKFYIEAVASEKLGLKEKTENFYRSLLHDSRSKAKAISCKVRATPLRLLPFFVWKVAGKVALLQFFMQ
jgi:phosphoglucomutase